MTGKQARNDGEAGARAVRRNSAFSTSEPEGRQRSRRDDGVCLTTVTGPVRARKREESAVKRLPDRV